MNTFRFWLGVIGVVFGLVGSWLILENPRSDGWMLLLFTVVIFLLGIRNILIALEVHE